MITFYHRLFLTVLTVGSLSVASTLYTQHSFWDELTYYHPQHEFVINFLRKSVDNLKEEESDQEAREFIDQIVRMKKEYSADSHQWEAMLILVGSIIRIYEYQTIYNEVPTHFHINSKSPVTVASVRKVLHRPPCTNS